MRKPKTDEELLERLKTKHPKVLEAVVNFDAMVAPVMENPPKDQPSKSKKRQK